MTWSRFWRALSLLAGLGATVWIVSRTGVGWADVVALPASAHLLAFAVMGVEVLGRGLRIRVLAAQLGVPMRVSTATLAQLAADAAGAVTPSKVGADPAKLWIFGRDGASLGSRGALVLGEMAWEIAVLMGVAIVLGILLPDGRTVPLAVATYAVIIFLLGALALWAAHRAGTEPPRFWAWLRLRPAQWRALQRQGKGFVKDSGALRSPSVPIAVGAFATTLLHMGARVSVLFALVVGMSGPPSDGVADLLLWPFGLLYLGSILPPPGGGGALEIGFAAALEGTLDPAALPVLLVWWRVYTFYLPAALGGLVLLFARRAGDASVPPPPVDDAPGVPEPVASEGS